MPTGPGVYRGQCAEFCGLQHAHMAFVVVADPPARFRALARARRRSRAGRRAATAQRRPSSAAAARAATRSAAPSATGDVGPDLTHLATRDDASPR